MIVSVYDIPDESIKKLFPDPPAIGSGVTSEQSLKVSSGGLTLSKWNKIIEDIDPDVNKQATFNDLEIRQRARFGLLGKI